MPSVQASDGCRIQYDRFGRDDGEPLVLIMGLAVDRWGWIRQRAELGARFRCIAIDNRGAGLSDKPDGPYDIFTMADDVLAVMDAEGIDAAHLVGYSMGGTLAQVIAVRSPERVRSLVLASTACRMQDWRREVFGEWASLIRERGVPAFARENLRWVAAARHLRWITPIAPAMAPLFVRAPARGVLGQLSALTDIDDQVHEELASIRVPALVVVGSQDILTPVADSEEIVHRVPHAEFVVVAGASHSLVVTDAALFNRAMSEFHDRVLTTADV